MTILTLPCVHVYLGDKEERCLVSDNSSASWVIEKELWGYKTTEGKSKQEVRTPFPFTWASHLQLQYSPQCFCQICCSQDIPDLVDSPMKFCWPVEDSVGGLTSKCCCQEMNNMLLRKKELPWARNLLCVGKLQEESFAHLLLFFFFFGAVWQLGMRYLWGRCASFMTSFQLQTCL